MNYLIVRNRPTAGASRLAEALGGKTSKKEGRPWKPRKNVYIVNWGCSSTPRFEDIPMLNPPDVVSEASNKLDFFDTCEGVSIPQYWTDKEEAYEWLMGKKKRALMVRKLLNSHSGKGCIHLVHNDSMTLGGVPDAPLYVEYVPKKAEYRVHCFRIEDQISAADVQKKRAKTSAVRNGLNYQIRNLSNGWIYARQVDFVPEDVITQAKLAFGCTGLDFGAVDVIWNKERAKAYVLEVNTAPGLEGSTVGTYAEYIKRICE